VPVSAPPSDVELIEALREHRDGRDIVGLSRHPYRYATSSPLEEIRVQVAGGSDLRLILKDLARGRLLADARAAKPPFLHDPRRELETYRRILAPSGIGARCLAAVADDDPPRHWLLIEKVPGVELWQVGELSVWEEVAAWLGGLHARFAGRLDELRAANPYLLENSESWFRSWRERAGGVLARSTDRRASGLQAALKGYDEVIESLAALPRTFIHGELYPSNVLVLRGQGSARVCPVDWEMAAIGPGLIDLAALVGGWSAPERWRLVAAYRGALAEAGAPAPSSEALAADLSRCRLHLALQWLGWSSEWRPPREHAHDWLGEALTLVQELELP
jgi:aminoglycoside phosphotransferase (APT) family kinase protein